MGRMGKWIAAALAVNGLLLTFGAAVAYLGGAMERVESLLIVAIGAAGLGLAGMAAILDVLIGLRRDLRD